MRNILCGIFGHQPPVYAETSWALLGQEYAEVVVVATDGTGRVHARVVGKCARCSEMFTVARIYVPDIGKRIGGYG